MKKNNILYMAPSLLLGLTLTSGLVLSSISVSADDSIVDDVTITVPESCTITTPSGSGQTYNESMMNGQYKNDIGKTRLSVFCNNNESFAIYAIGYSNDTYGNTEMIAATSGTGITNIPTGTATSGDSSQWAMKLETVNGTGGAYTPTIVSPFNNFSNIPSTYSKVAEVTSTTSLTAEAAVDVSYAVYISQAQAAGSYTGKVRYTAVHPSSEAPLQPHDCDPNKICYWPNASGVTDSMGDQTTTGPYLNAQYEYIDDIAITSGANVTLWASNFKRQGYGFVGWSDKFDWVLNANDASGNGTGENEGYHIYGPNQNITTPSNMTEKGLSLYAVWVKSTGNIQSWTGCGAMNVGQVTALTDQRDNDTYAIAKLADDKCWMIENLRLDNTNSDNATGDLAQGYNTSTFKGLADPETPPNTFTTTNPNSLYSTDGTNNTFAITGSSLSSRFPRYNNTNTSNTVTNMTTPTDADIYSYGNYYTWSAAIADTTNYTTSGQTISNTSICPKGWHLPTGNTGGDFSSLDSSMGGTGAYQPTTEASNRWRSYPNNFVYSGSVYSSSVVDRGSYGLYWSSTVYNSYYAYYLGFSSSYVYPGTVSYYKDSGFMARCIAGS